MVALKSYDKYYLIGIKYYTILEHVVIWSFAFVFEIWIISSQIRTHGKPCRKMVSLVMILQCSRSGLSTPDNCQNIHKYTKTAICLQIPGKSFPDSCPITFLSSNIFKKVQFDLHISVKWKLVLVKFLHYSADNR